MKHLPPQRKVISWVVTFPHVQHHAGGLTIAMLLNQSQYDTFLTCNCYNYDNYTSSTWSSPASTFYNTIVAIPAPNSWYVAFVEPANNPNRGYFTDTETLQLIST